MQRLSGVEGMDAQRALEGVGGQPAALERILRRFVNIYRQGEPSLITAQGERDGARLAAVCHSLRGACAAVGAVSLQGRLMELEQSLKAGAPPAQALDTVQHINAELMQFVARIDGEMGV
jgi:HPt (histidine-containing phosphotransfer) domain-containing protein